MEIKSINSPLWVQKLDDVKLRQYIEALDNYETNGAIEEQLLTSAMTQYSKKILSENIACLARDIYIESMLRWYKGK